MFQMTPKHPSFVPAETVAPVRTTLVLHGLTADLESLVKTHPYAATAQAYQAALESQQLDHSAQQAAEDEVEDTLDKYASDHPRTGPMHVYLLGNPGAASFDQDHETTPMKALVNAALRNKSKLVAALMPEDETVFQIADIPLSLTLRQLADTVLAQESIPVLVGKAAFESFIQDPAAYLRRLERRSRLTPAMEADAGVVTSLSILGAVAALNIGFWVHDKLKAWRHDRTLKGLPDSEKRKLDQSTDVRDAITQLKHSYGNPAWYDKQTFAQGEVSGLGIRDYLLAGTEITHDPAGAVTHHLAAVHENFGKIVGAVDAYAKRVNPIAEEMIKKFNAGATSKEVVAWAEGKLKTVPEPLAGVAFNLKGMLGNPVVTHDHDEWNIDFAWHAHQYSSTVVESDSKIPALSKEQAKAAGLALVKLLEAVADYMTNWSYDDGPMDIYEMAERVGSSPEDAERFDDLWEAMIDNVSQHYWHSDLEGKYDTLRYFMINSLPEVAMGLERWIHRSIVKPKA